MEKPKCKQKVGGAECAEPAAYRFTWAGQDESFICEKHVGKLRGVAAAMGYYVQVIPLSDDERAAPSRQGAQDGL